MKDGKVSWKYDTGGAVFSSPSFDDGIVYIGCNTGRVFGIKEGRKLWSFRTGNDLDSSPVIRDGIVYVGGKDHLLYAITPPETALKRAVEAPEQPPAAAGETTVENTEEWIIIDGIRMAVNRENK